MKDTSSELLETILKEEQATVEIEDQPKNKASKMSVHEENKEEAKTEIDIVEGRGSSRSLMRALEEDKEIFRDNEEEVTNYSSFTVLEKIGEGGFGQVFKVKLNKTNEIFAMKSISKSYLLKTKQLKYAQNECKILREMNNPFVIKMHYAFQTPQHLYFVLDYCEGGDLSIHIAKKEMFEEYEAKFYLAELILAIEYLHAKDIIYRDLKPENVLLCTGTHNFYSKGWTSKAIRLWFGKASVWSESESGPEFLRQPGLSDSRNASQERRRQIPRHLRHGSHTVRTPNRNPSLLRCRHRHDV
eukprot:TRINITY_DN8092_c0_g1_i2.p1 TRINITY_DN8092_c0_g1~~TRINITY_DN8092_c0_g1_i2.p1  ORF type:complete len:300 (+),score=77.01 TRINITY_DN8092_c0_g1_i2:1647-2546(+)